MNKILIATLLLGAAAPADAEVHVAVDGVGEVARAQAFLHVHGAAHGFDGALELGEDGIARGVEDAAAASLHATTNQRRALGRLDCFATDTSRLDELAPRFLGEALTGFELVDL